MIRPARFRALCGGLSDVEEHPHFDRAAFRTSVRIFTTLAADGKSANVLLLPEMQQQLVDGHPDVFVRLKGAWGARGWTWMNLVQIDEGMCRDVLREACALAQPQRKARSRAKAKVKAKPKR